MTMTDETRMMTEKTKMIDRKPRRVLVPALLVLALGGCTLQPNYDRPAMPVPSQWHQRN